MDPEAIMTLLRDFPTMAAAHNSVEALMAFLKREMAQAVDPITHKWPFPPRQSQAVSLAYRRKDGSETERMAT